MPLALPRLRQAVLAARELEPVTEQLRDAFGLGEPYHDEGVAYFGLRNAVFALGDTFLEVVSPLREGTAAGRLLDRRGADVCGYMLMFQVAELAPARARAAAEGVREVFAVDLDDIAEVHLHPGDLRGAIVALSAPAPPGAWRWGGPDWAARAAPGHIAGATVAVAGAEVVAPRWQQVIGALPGVRLVPDSDDAGLVEVTLRGAPRTLQLDAVEVISEPQEEDDP
jgi:hypothetical protein